MIKITEEIKNQFNDILINNKMVSVYQPIFSLQNGSILGYEALTRLSIDLPLFNIEQLFEIGESLEVLWKLEELCRKNSFAGLRHKLDGKKLFINVDPNVIHDPKFRSGTTAYALYEYGLTPNDIVFEITERNSIDDLDTFVQTIDHYRAQTYQIAIDDFGAGYAGITRVCSLTPDYIKIDMMMIRNIDKDQMKATIIKSFVSFCKQTNCKLIAEGIETMEELQTLIELGVHYGQGYFLAKPSTELAISTKHIEDTITHYYKKHIHYEYGPSFLGNISSICTKRETVSPDALGRDVFEYVRKNHDITELCVVDELQRVCGILTRSYLLETYGGRFGYDLNLRKKVIDIMPQHFLVVDATTSIEAVSKIALSRNYENIYDAVIVVNEDQYSGIVTVKDLLEAAINIQVLKATDANPLTKLPGNAAIQSTVETMILEDNPYAAIYIDIDNFKAYNDAYGFYNGDLMIKTVARCMDIVCTNSEFKGHIGGDDFIIIANRYDVKKMCTTLFELFSDAIRELYHEQDLLDGRILSKDRYGNICSFPLASLSIAVLTNKDLKVADLDTYSKELAKIKKISKQKEGNSLAIR